LCGCSRISAWAIGVEKVVISTFDINKVYQKIYVASFKKDQQLVHMSREIRRKKAVENVKSGDNFIV
jgi:hypothetical protein